MPCCFFLLIPDATDGLLSLADTRLRVIASGQVRAVARAVTGGCAHYYCVLMKCEQYWFVAPRYGNGGYLHQRDHGQGAKLSKARWKLRVGLSNNLRSVRSFT